MTKLIKKIKKNNGKKKDIFFTTLYELMLYIKIYKMLSLADTDNRYLLIFYNLSLNIRTNI